jgi:hypothetical protein
VSARVGGRRGAGAFIVNPDLCSRRTVALRLALYVGGLQIEAIWFTQRVADFCINLRLSTQMPTFSQLLSRALVFAMAAVASEPRSIGALRAAAWSAAQTNGQ